MAEQAELAVTTEQATETATTTEAATTATETTQTPEQIKAAETEAARVAALTPEQKKAEEDKVAAEKKAADEAPKDFKSLKMPEGYKADDPAFAEAVKMFEAEKISPAQAQKLLNFTVERDKALAKAIGDNNAAAFEKTRSDWKAEAAKIHSEEDRGIAKTALSKIYDAKTLAFLESWGLTDHPGFIAGAVKVGKAIKDDTFVGGNAAVANGSDARTHFPNSNMNP